MKKLLHSGTSMGKGLWKLSKIAAPVAAFAFLSAEVSAQATLPIFEDFSGAGPTTTFQSNQASINGLGGTGYSWAFETSTSQGRIRFTPGAAYYQCGNAAATLDANPSGAFPDPINFLTLEVDMTTYTGASNIELAFNWMDHGEETDVNDRCWIRGANTDPWIEVVNWVLPNPPNGQWQTAIIDVDAELAANSQTVSSTFQVRFGQQDNFQSTSITASDGITIDNVQLTGGVPVDPDVSAVALLSLAGSSGGSLTCAGATNAPTVYLEDGLCAGDYDFDIVVTNNGTTTQSNIPVEFVLDGTTYTGTVVGPLDPLDADTITIQAPGLVGSTNGTVLLGAAYVNLTGDLNLSNDTTDSLELTVYDNTPISQSNYPNLNLPAQTGTFSTSTFVCGLGVMDSCNYLSCVVIDSMPHLWTGNVTIELESPQGTVIDLIATPAGGTGDNFYNVVFKDDATTPISINNNGILPGNYFPADPLSTFWGESGDGEWSLHINQNNTLGGGSLDKWSLVFKNDNPSLGLDTTVCDTNAFMLSPGNQFATYTWDPPAGGASSFVVTNPGTNTYSVTTTNQEGTCTSSASVNVSLGYQVDLGPNISLCQGETFTYDLGPAYVAATWTGGGTPSGVTLTVDAVGTYGVTATDSVGCISMSTGIVDQVFQVQPIDLGMDVDLCDGEFTVLDAGTGFNAYAWTDGVLGQTRIIVGTGTYTIVATDGNGCTSSDDVTVTVNPPPFLPADLGSGEGTNIFFKDPNETVNFSQFGTDNLWTVTNPNAIFTSQTISVTTAIGGHIVTLDATDAATGCSSTGTVVITSYPTGVDDPNEVGLISLFPNPNNGQFTLMNTGAREQVSLQVVDVQGRVVMNNPNVVLETGTGYEVDLTSQAKGMYLVNLVRAESTEQIRVVVE